MKYSAIILSCLLGLGACIPPPPDAPNSSSSRGGISLFTNRVGLNMCSLCIQFTGEAINELLNIILNAGVVSTCGALCQELEEKTGSEALGAVCNILCDIVGIEEFVKLVEKADLDPIYFCEELKTCTVFDGGDAEITNLEIDPASGPQGPKTISFTINSKNGTGTGELVLFVQTVDGVPVEDSLLMEAQNASSFPAPQSFSLKATPDPNCDPTQQPCEQWLPGNYQLVVDICNGECGSKHPHSKLYDRKMANFTITG